MKPWYTAFNTETGDYVRQEGDILKFETIEWALGYIKRQCGYQRWSNTDLLKIFRFEENTKCL